MKTILLVTGLFFTMRAEAQSARTYTYKTEITDSNYVIIWRKSAWGRYKIDSEGPVDAGVEITTFNFSEYRTGIWKHYLIQNPGSVVRTEYLHGTMLGTYTHTSADGSYRIYIMVKNGKSTISHYTKGGHLTQRESVDLNDPERTTEKTFYDLQGNPVRTEIWKNGVQV